MMPGISRDMLQPVRCAMQCGRVLQRPLYLTHNEPRRSFASSRSMMMESPSDSAAAATNSSSLASSTSNNSIASILSKPTWSVQSLIPPANPTDAFPISRTELHHLLKLSALPLPASEEEEATMLRTLSSQLHFVNAIRSIDTTGVEPLAAIRDETAAGERALEQAADAEVTQALGKEDLIGQHFPRIRRRKQGKGKRDGGVVDEETPEGWKPLDGAKKKEGRFFVVEKVEGASKERGK